MATWIMRSYSINWCEVATALARNPPFNILDDMDVMVYDQIHSVERTDYHLLVRLGCHLSIDSNSYRARLLRQISESNRLGGYSTIKSLRFRTGKLEKCLAWESKRLVLVILGRCDRWKRPEWDKWHPDVTRGCRLGRSALLLPCNAVRGVIELSVHHNRQLFMGR